MYTGIAIQPINFWMTLSRQFLSSYNSCGNIFHKPKVMKKYFVHWLMNVSLAEHEYVCLCVSVCVCVWICACEWPDENLLSAAGDGCHCQYPYPSRHCRLPLRISVAWPTPLQVFTGLAVVKIHTFMKLSHIHNNITIKKCAAHINICQLILFLVPFIKKST